MSETNKGDHFFYWVEGNFPLSLGFSLSIVIVHGLKIFSNRESWQPGGMAAPNLLILSMSASSPSRSAVNHRVRTRAKFFRRRPEVFLKGVTYGTFAPDDAAGFYVGPPEKARRDLAMMKAIGINGVRIYHAPPKWFLDLAQENGIRVMVTLWWGQNVDFLSTNKRRREIFDKVHYDVKSNAGHPGLMGYLVANEISSLMVRRVCGR